MSVNRPIERVIMLEIKNLKVAVEDKVILKGVTLTINDGEIHAIMGPNGSGKSTLANIIAGKDGYEILEGEILLNGENILELDPEERAHRGLFLGFQHPAELPGVNNMYFLKSAVNSIRKARGESEMDAMEFYDFLQAKMKDVKMDGSFLKRFVNEGFSGGEKKRNEILQMLVLEPTHIVLDETDSGLDIDALKVISEGINTLKSKERCFLLITHYQRLLNYIEPDVVHVLVDGEILASGDKALALELEKNGYVNYRGSNAGGSRQN